MTNSIGIPADEFETQYQEVIKNQVDEHIKQSRELLNKVGGNGFPTLVELSQSQTTQSQTITHPISNYYGKPDAWQAYLDSLFVNRSSQAI